MSTRDFRPLALFLLCLFFICFLMIHAGAFSESGNARMLSSADSSDEAEAAAPGEDATPDNSVSVSSLDELDLLEIREILATISEDVAAIQQEMTSRQKVLDGYQDEGDILRNPGDVVGEWEDVPEGEEQEEEEEVIEAEEESGGASATISTDETSEGEESLQDEIQPVTLDDIHRDLTFILVSLWILGGVWFAFKLGATFLGR